MRLLSGTDHDAWVSIDSHNMGDLSRECSRDCSANASRRSKDNHHTSRQAQIHGASLGTSRIRSLGTLAAGLLITPADLDHPVTRGRFGIFCLCAFTGFTKLLGRQSAAP
jgi:hypothetical protein